MAGVRWPLNDQLGSESSIVKDVEYLMTQPVAILAWPTLPGWDQSERRYALRHHAGVLRLLHGLLQRGLSAGLMNVPSETLATWEDKLVE